MGYTFLRRRIKFIAYILLFNIAFNLLQPLSAYALTSGPAQPESQSFQPAGVSDMVDLFSGDFKYNIPLMDVDGYPLNLNYQSGVGMDDEASWVGLGWNLNVGSISRQLRGVPDDFKGDTLRTTHTTKEKITVGGRLTAKVEVRGKLRPENKITDNAGAKLTGSFTFGIFSDNYTGVGAELGVNAGISYSFIGSSYLTGSMGVGVLSNTASGVDVSPSISLSIGELAKAKGTVNAGLSSSLGYNSRSGLKSLTLGGSFSNYNLSTDLISYNTEPIYPKIQIPYTSTYDSFSIDVGGVAFAIFGGVGGTGYVSKRKVANNGIFINPEYGFLYADQGKNTKTAIQDFIREKENPVIKELPNLALPVHTPDIFTYTSQTGSGQFRLYRGGTGAFSDNEVSDQSYVNTLGYDIGLGLYAHAGVTLFQQTTKNTTRKWATDNKYLEKGDFQSASASDPKYEHVYFRKTGEFNLETPHAQEDLRGTEPVSINVDDHGANSLFNTNANFLTNNIIGPIIQTEREIRGTTISYLTAAEAKLAALDKAIPVYNFIDTANFNMFLNSPHIPTYISRVDSVLRKKHHISEITVTGQGSERMVYGIPVYNHKQEEYSFAIGENNNKVKNYTGIEGNLAVLGVTSGEPSHIGRGVDDYYHKESQPGYASTYLLTAMLSSDYVDKTGNGVTEDDPGTAIKFNYSRIDKYKWRTPYGTKKGTPTGFKKTMAVNKGLLADPEDDKGSIIYGEKELYYVHSIESKTQVAYFITTNRLDGLGVKDWEGEREDNIKQKVLKEIRLYSKSDFNKPIKIVKFTYSYELCKESPNSMGDINNLTDPNGDHHNNGKLTLKSVWFEYGNSHKGKAHPYKFSYNNSTVYATMATDRWGTYKSAAHPGGLTNEEYPYTHQDKGTADVNASLFHLTKIDLPTGGVINVDYESDDYAYVQNKKAAVMTSVKSMVKNGVDQGNSLIEANGIKIPIDLLPPDYLTTPAAKLAWFKNTYLSGSDYIYTKMYVKIGTEDKLSHEMNEDFISTYCKVNQVDFSDSTALVYFEQGNEAGVTENPIRFSAWQKMKTEYPRYAYPGFLNRVNNNSVGSDVKAAVSAIANAAKNLSELKENFYKKANRKQYARSANLAKSFVRISKINGYKLGGGVRVKEIQISDEWRNFTGDQTASEGKYGQQYEYTIQDGSRKISSGVASYEPAVGSDENPLRQPLSYVQKIKGAIGNYYEMEAPFGESLFPPPGVGYSQVSVRDLDVNSDPMTGSIVNEFYTAKDFPVRVNVLPIQRKTPDKRRSYSLIAANSMEEMTLSQGYSIELNDMHGKPRAVRVFNKLKAEISSTIYHYRVENDKAPELRLNNKVDVIGRDGQISSGVYMGRDIEFFTDFREQESINSGEAINIGFDLIPGFLVFPLPIPHWPVNGNNEYKRFRSACALKVIESHGIIEKVEKTENGSTIYSENIAYDGLTGEAVVTRTQNEFNDNYYTTNIPAHWIYPYMGGAYQNAGIVLDKLTLDSQDQIGAPMNTVLNEGDEIVGLTTGLRYWVMGAVAKVLINSKGERVKAASVSGSYKILRSAFKNQLSSSAGTVVSMGNPLQGGALVLASASDVPAALKVISAAATVYDDNWGVKPFCDLPTFNVIENTSRCFSFSGGSVFEDYSGLGTKIQEFPNSTEIVVTSQYLGGQACSGSSLMAAKSASDTSSAAAVSLKAQQKGMVTNMAYNSNCTRPDQANDYVDCWSNWPLNRSGIWLSMPVIENLDEDMGFEKCIDFPESKYYYFGFAADNGMYMEVDGVLMIGWMLSEYDDDSYLYWNIRPLFLTKGKHIIKMTFLNHQVGSSEENANNIASAGLEIYNCTYQQLINHLPYSSSPDPYLLFTTKSLRGQDVQSFRETGAFTDTYTYHYTYPDGSKYVECEAGSKQVNPYLQGFKGNWRPFEAKVNQSSRSYDQIFEPGKRGVNVRNSGYLSKFKPYWSYSSSPALTWIVNTDNNQWITANTITLYDKYGQELENKDALNRYSAAKFDFKGELPSAVASNAMYREIFVSSFEFNTNSVSPEDCNSPDFSWLDAPEPNYYLSPYYSHSGNRSANLPANGVTLTTIRHERESSKANSYVGIKSNGDYFLQNTPGLFPNGFEPRTSEKYLFNAWIYDHDNLQVNRTINMTLGIKGTGTTFNNVPLTCKAVVEKWKLVEGIIDLATLPGTALEIKLTPFNSNVFIDDIRIQPLKSHLKSYVYGYNLKLMAELDENCMATFYEYDDQGSLTRVKKETERGILTIKESRSSYRKTK
ncbi:MAG TPA: hypothetical protein VK541_15580 [Pedobacter sp.]|uniref:hypothetical protein n=1 Tax=Pedobacter sp. TaxID=1411316 RepID=UPI002CD669B6|nr:hypothetical protein [Pedobacter sp.]HMI03906.1 hypothetical protein [Pedobacter sp.]